MKILKVIVIKIVTFGPILSLVNFFKLLAQFILQEQTKAAFHSCGERVHIHAKSVFEGPKHISVGSDVAISSFVHIWGQGGVEIGNRVLIASHVALISVSHDSCAPSIYGTTVLGPLRIGDDVWIGAGAVILPNVTIGNGAIIGSGAVVRHDVAPNTVVGGVPAVQIRKRIK